MNLRSAKRLAAKLDGTPRCFQLADVEVRKAPEGSASPGGVRFYAALYNSRSLDLGGFEEEIAPGAFDAAVTEDDIRALFNHDSNLVLGRSAPAKGIATASIVADERGLLVDIPKLPDTSYARDLLALLDRGDVDQSSFGFRVVSDEWEQRDGKLVRTLVEVRLFDVSIVTFPAYTETVAEARSLALALADLRAGKVLSQKNRDTIAGVVDALAGLLQEADGTNDDLYNFNSIRSARGSLREKRDADVIVSLAWILDDCECFVEWYADDDADKAAMQEVIAQVKAMIGKELSDSDADDEARGLRAIDRRDGSTIYMLGWIIAECEDFVAFYADDDEDKAAMNEVIARLKAMVAVEAAPDADDEAAEEDGERSQGADIELRRAQLRLLELAAPEPTPTLR